MRLPDVKDGITFYVCTANGKSDCRQKDGIAGKQKNRNCIFEEVC